GHVGPGIHTVEQFGEERFVAGELHGKEWTPLFANVDGRLPADRIVEGALPGKYLGLVGLYAATQLQLARSTSVKLKFTGAAGAAVWIDGKAQKPNPDLTANLASGIHTIVVRLDPGK